MTLLAMSLNYGHPILMADILLSSSNSDGEIKTPSFMQGTGKILKSIPGAKPINKLVQKLYIINPQLCIAVGGRHDQMYSFLKSIKAYFENHIPSEKELVDFMEYYDQEKKTHLIALVLFAVNENNRVKFTSHIIGEWKGRKHQLFEEVIANGSGQEDYLNEIGNSFNQVFRRNESNNPEDPFISAVENNLLVYTRFLGLESITAQTLLKNWGAGFEIILFVSGRFLKLDDITFLTMVGEKILNKPLKVGPKNCLKFFYHDEALIIRANGVGQEQVFCAIPIDKEEKYKSFEVNLRDYNSNITLLAFAIKSDGDILQTPALVIPNNLETPHPSVKITTDNSTLQIIIDRKIEETIEFSISNK